VPDEAPRHYIDMDEYGDSAIFNLPKYWSKAVEKFGEDTLKAHGIVPWHIVRMLNQLKEAFVLIDPVKILRCSAELGHYVGDAHVPLHTTRNYNGQLSGQQGIHGFWESRLPELFFDDYNFFVGRATYIDDPQAAAWTVVLQSNAWVDAGQPDLKRLINYSPTQEELKGREEELKKWKERVFQAREHEHAEPFR
jgi:hypothetical protein